MSVTELGDWEYHCVGLHRGKSTPPHRSDEDDDDYDDYPLACCDEKPPRSKNFSVSSVRASGRFIAAHDYDSAVHPWLMDKRDDILGAIGVYGGILLAIRRPITDIDGVLYSGKTLH